MEWQDIIRTRKTTFTFADKLVDKTIVDEILQELHDFMPSKQNKMPFEISVLDWSNADLRHWIFQDCHRDDLATVEEDTGNPQILAPWLFAFSVRSLSDEEILDNSECKSDAYMSKQGNIEIGIASSFIVYNAQSRGLATGYCGCIRTPDEMGQRLGHQNRINVLLGLGYPETKDQYFDPRINANRPIPHDHAFHKTRQPKVNEYIKWHL